MNENASPGESPEPKADEKIKRRKTNFHNPRPDHFVGIKIFNQEIINNVEKVQQHLLQKNKSLEKVLISLPTLHLTLAVMKLDMEDEETIKRAIEALESCCDKLGSGLTEDPLVLPFEGLDHFKSGVLYSKVKEGDALDRLSDIAREVRESFTSRGIVLTDDRFSPHLTLLKVSKLQGQWKEKKAIMKLFQGKFYEEYQDMLFGTERIVSLQLLSMTADKDVHGYYHCLKSISFDANA